MLQQNVTTILKLPSFSTSIQILDYIKINIQLYIQRTSSITIMISQTYKYICRVLTSLDSMTMNLDPTKFRTRPNFIWRIGKIMNYELECHG